jgi:glycosyltransferase involved in cell wall biosynthesis
MTISFIIPVYNCKAFLPDCVSSIRQAGLSDYEILLIDDGSTDGSGALCDELASGCPEIRVIHQANAGVSAARNRGIREASGQLLLFMDADDSIDSQLLSDVLTDPRCMEVHMVIYGLTFDYYKNGRCYRQDPIFYPTNGILYSQDWGANFLSLFEHNSLSPVWNKVYCTEILQKYGLQFNEDMFLYEDLEFVLRYLQHCDTIWNVPKSIYHYRQSEDEGNAKRRLMRIHSIADFLASIETSLTALAVSNPAITSELCETILQQLYLVLAREKISVSDLSGIRMICKDSADWFHGRDFSLEPSAFYENLTEKKALRLLLAARKSALRHKVAVWVKSHLYSI